MSRRKAAPKREILPDPLFKSKVLAKFINCVMRSGKKSLAEQIVYGALSLMVERDAKANKKQAEDGGEEGGSSTGSGSIGTPDIRTNPKARERALALFEEALEKVMPTVEVKSRRVGGSTYQVPVEIRGARRVALGMRWVTDFACKRGEKTMVQRLAGELMDALEGRGASIKKREDTHRMAKANQAFAHYRW